MSDSPAQNAFQGSLQTQIDTLPDAWRDALQAPHLQGILRKLDAMLAQRLAAGAEIYPLRPFRALLETPPESVQVVIVGQDPYHGPNQAQGLAFSVPSFCPTPPSLRNMFKELALEYGEPAAPPRNSLVRWARQGVLLLNTSLTVEAHQPASHAKQGWEHVTDALIMRVLREARPKVLLLWGSHAQARRQLLQLQPPAGPVEVLMANHPSPLSALRPPRPFIGCGHFRQANDWLQAHGESGIDWMLGKTPQAAAGYGG
ncbi:uracil-DNA glycosylase [Castellaniella caeni]|uniref:uracil-DNA glycosylase n=1 Tax=Castellaniella caeni TaxID=266123 RepID=UPI00082ED145|nr:uracil-DNA glycosylase [Castellaniella caeni]